MLSDNLLGRVTLDALGPHVPSGYYAMRVDLEDRVVDNRFDKASIPALALHENLLRFLPFCNVASDLCEPD